MKLTNGGKLVTFVGSVLFCLLFSVTARAQDDAALAKALTGVTVSLEQGLRASAARGVPSKSEAITGGDDLTAAKSQGAALAKAKGTLLDAVARVLKANAGAHAVSATAALETGHPIAKITLLQGQTFKTVSEKLD